jgi:hypothetical protein
LNILNHPAIKQRRKSNIKAIRFSLTPKEFEEKLINIASKQSLLSDGNSGIVSYSTTKGGVTFHYTYDGSNILTITIDHSAFMVTDAEIYNQIKAWFKQDL